MSELTPEQEAMKQAIWDRMSPRRKKFVERMGGYETWDPFQEPKDPIDIRKDPTRRTATQLMHEFRASLPKDKKYSEAFHRGAQEIAFGLMTEQDRFEGMYEFSSWYYKLMKKEGLINDD